MINNSLDIIYRCLALGIPGYLEHPGASMIFPSRNQALAQEEEDLGGALSLGGWFQGAPLDEDRDKAILSERMRLRKCR